MPARKPVKKAPAKKAPARKAPARKAPAKKTAAKKAPAKKAPAKKTAAKKAPARKAPAKKTTAKKAPARKAPAKRSPAKKAPAKKTAARKAPARKAPAKRTPAKKAPARKVAAKKVPSKPTKATQTEHMFDYKVPTGMYCYLLDVPYDDRQTASWAKARWNPQLKSWVYLAPKGTSLPEKLRPFAAPRHSWEAFREAKLNGGLQSDAAAGSKVTLFDHQVEGADQIMKAYNAGRSGFLLASDTGTGKTYTMLEAVRRMPAGQNVLIVAPLSTIPAWRRSIDDFGVGGLHNFVVINYERLKKLLTTPDSAADAKRTRTKNKRIAAKGLPVVDFHTVIADECHKVKNPTSQRSRALTQICKGTQRGNDSFVMYASATSSQNPTEIVYFSKVLGEVTGHKFTGDIDEAFEEWCRDHMEFSISKSFGSLKWNKNTEDLEKVRKLLFDDGITALRHTASDIAGWPEQHLIPTPIELTAQQMAIYNDSWAMVEVALREDRKLKENGKPRHTGVSDKMNPLVALLRHRQAASTLRLPSTVAFICDMLENGYQVAVNCEFRDTVADLAERLEKKGIAVYQIHGGMNPAEREENRLAFQREGSVILYTPVEGLNLQANEVAVGGNDVPRVNLIADMRWSAVSLQQAAGRCHRAGEYAPTYLMYGADTVEEKVTMACLEKALNMAHMQNDDTSAIQELLDSLVD
jgi:superfamily II DNA or RNA helicase